MKPVDLTQHPPRSPYDKLDGLMLMPRTIDKMRALLPGGTPGSYKIPGMSYALLDIIGVQEQDLQKAVADAETEGDVATWLRSHADTAKYDEANERLSKRKIADTKDPAGVRQRYPILERRSDILTLFDLVIADDAETFGSHAQ
jgi:hypothetical protein